MLFYILLRLGISTEAHSGLACYSISYYALAVSAKAWNAILQESISQRALAVFSKAWNAILYLSINRGLECYYISYHALAVSMDFEDIATSIGARQPNDDPRPGFYIAYREAEHNGEGQANVRRGKI